MRRLVVVVGGVLCALLVGGCGQAGGDGDGSVRPTSGGYVPGVDGEGAAARRVFTPEELLPALLPSKAGGPGTIGQLGLGTGPGKGELMADCPSRAKDMVAELYRMTAPRVTQLTPVEEGDAAPGPHGADRDDVP